MLELKCFQASCPFNKGSEWCNRGDGTEVTLPSIIPMVILVGDQRLVLAVCQEALSP